METKGWKQRMEMETEIEMEMEMSSEEQKTGRRPLIPTTVHRLLTGTAAKNLQPMADTAPESGQSEQLYIVGRMKSVHHNGAMSEFLVRIFKNSLQLVIMLLPAGGRRPEDQGRDLGREVPAPGKHTQIMSLILSRTNAKKKSRHRFQIPTR